MYYVIHPAAPPYPITRKATFRSTRDTPGTGTLDLCRTARGQTPKSVMITTVGSSESRHPIRPDLVVSSVSPSPHHSPPARRAAHSRPPQYTSPWHAPSTPRRQSMEFPPTTSMGTSQHPLNCWGSKGSSGPPSITRCHQSQPSFTKSPPARLWPDFPMYPSKKKNLSGSWDTQLLAGRTTTCVSHEDFDFIPSWDMQPFKVWLIPTVWLTIHFFCPVLGFLYSSSHHHTILLH